MADEQQILKCSTLKKKKKRNSPVLNAIVLHNIILYTQILQKYYVYVYYIIVKITIPIKEKSTIEHQISWYRQKPVN